MKAARSNRFKLMCILLSLLVLFGGGGRSPTTVLADSIDHTHIWATTYDTTNHWEYCTVCGEKQNVTAHSYTDHWNYGYESCGSGNYSTRTCDCGYSYKYIKPHNMDYTQISGNPNLTWKQHYFKCKSCGQSFGQKCTHNGKQISCLNSGTCDVCGANYEADMGHTLNSQGKCTTCGKQFFNIISSSFQYSDDYKTGKFITKIKVNYDYVSFANIYWYSRDVVGTMKANGYTLDSDGVTRIYIWDITFNNFVKTGWYYLCMTVKINNGYSQSEGGAGYNITGDHTAPIISEIIQTDQASSNGWATIKQITVSGTEASAGVRVTIKDKVTGEVFLNNAYVNVTDGKYSYTCTPPLEGDEKGRIYICQVTDVNGNISTKEFTVSKTDGSAPTLKSGTSLSYTDWTHTVKNISLSFYDFGAGSVMASLDNQTSYQELTKSGEYYIWNKSFGNQVGTTDHKLYVKDSLGNATVYTMTVGNVDTNTYTITYNLDGGTASGLKTTYTVEDTFMLPQVSKNGYIFTGYSGSNGSTPQTKVTVNKGTRGNLSYTVNWTPIHFTVKYDANGGTGTMADSFHVYKGGSKLSKCSFSRTGFTFLYWKYSKVLNGKTVWLYTDSNGNYADGGLWYEDGKNPSGTRIAIGYDGVGFHAQTFVDGDVITAHAQWTYNKISVKIPQMLTGDKSGNGSFMVKCDDIQSGKINVSVPAAFTYKQTGKSDISAMITCKSSSNVISPLNKYVIYGISTNNLSAGSWQGTFNIELTLTE